MTITEEVDQAAHLAAKNSVAKRLAYWLGCAAAIAGVAFVANRLITYRNSIDFNLLEAANWPLIAFLVLVSTFAYSLLAVAWWRVLDGVRTPTSPAWAFRTYGISQLGKYVPGTIFQFAGRQALGIAEGLPKWPLARSMVWEFLGQCLGAAVFAVLALPLYTKSVSHPLADIGFVATLIVALFAVRRFLGRSMAQAAVFYLGFLLLSSTVFLATLITVAPSAEIAIGQYPAVMGAFVIAWLVGMVVPGAPAGIGVREAMLLFLLHGLIPEHDLLTIVLLHRMMSVVGDLLLFLLAWLIPFRPALAPE